MINSLINGFARHEIWTNGPDAFALPSLPSILTFCRLVLAYMPITGPDVLLAGRPSTVTLAIGTSMAIVLILEPLKRFTPNGSAASLASSAALSAGGKRRRLAVSKTA